jgi:hypothetical protein
VLDYGWRRRGGDGRRWIHGKVEIRPDEVTFADGTQPIYVPPPQTDVPDLEADLARDPAFLAAIQDDRFANAVYSAFNRSFYKGSDERAWLYGSRMAARLIRDLRGLGESYQDWFPHGGLRGVYPDDRPAREASLRKSIEDTSRPIEFSRVVPSTIPEAARTEILKQFEAKRAEFEQHLPQMEEARLTSLENAKRALAMLDENADVFRALRDHLARLGWRSESAEDHRRLHARLISKAIAVLQNIKELEKRPADTPGAWAESFRQRQGPLAGPVRLIEKGSMDHLSEDEREASTGGVQRRLRDLAISGRITREEYDSLNARLGQN